jgi:hypothetical protein
MVEKVLDMRGNSTPAERAVSEITAIAESAELGNVCFEHRPRNLSGLGAAGGNAFSRSPHNRNLAPIPTHCRHQQLPSTVFSIRTSPVSTLLRITY